MTLDHRGQLEMYEDREFIVDTYPLFASLQRIVREYEATLPVGVRPTPSSEQVQYYARICSLYRQTILKHLARVQPDRQRVQHYSTMHSILSLTEILYLPADGTGEGVVGEELLDWLNVVDRAPSTEEGTELSTLAHPWESPDFFPYLTKCLIRGHSSSLSALFQLLITSHPLATIRTLSSTFLELLNQFPRSNDVEKFSTEPQFRQSLNRFKLAANRTLSQTVKPLYDQLEKTTTDLERDQVEEYLIAFKSLFSLLTLSTTSSTSCSESLDVLSNCCETWQEYLIAYVVYYEPLSTRQDLPRILSNTILSSSTGGGGAGGGGGRACFSVDQTLLEEKVQEQLFKGDVTGLLKSLVTTDVEGQGQGQGQGEGEGEGGEWIWLATHLIDLLSHLDLPAFDLPRSYFELPQEEEEEEDDDEMGKKGSWSSSLGPREEFLLSYADALIRGDETLWRVCCDYWGECGRVGRNRIGALLGRGEGVSSLVDQDVEDEVEGEGDGMMQVDGNGIKEKNKGRKNVEEVLTVLGEYGMEDKVKSVCQTYAETLIDRSQYGKALAYCVRAGDHQKIDRIGYKILNAYVDEGQERFIAHVDSLPTSLLRPTVSSSPPASPSSLSEPSLFPPPPTSASPYPLITFLSRYRDFLALYSLASQKASSTQQQTTPGQEQEEEEEEEAEDSIGQAWRMKRQSAELLILLLTSGMAPKTFWAVMLLDSVGLLETQPPLVSLSETYELLRVIEELTSPIQLSSSSSSSSSTTSSGPIVDIFGDLDMLGRLLEGQDPTSGGKSGKGEEGTRTERALKQLDVVRGALARHLAICCCL